MMICQACCFLFVALQAQTGLNVRVAHVNADTSILYVFLPQVFEKYEANAADAFTGRLVVTAGSYTQTFSFRPDVQHTASDDIHLILGMPFVLPAKGQYSITLTVDCIDASFNATQAYSGIKTVETSVPLLELVDRNYLTPVPHCCLQLAHDYLLRVNKPGGTVWVTAANMIKPTTQAGSSFSPKQDTILRFDKPLILRLQLAANPSAPTLDFRFGPIDK
jgi:hypothetical protein